MTHVTQKDIAKALGISQATVALVVRKTDSPLRRRLSPETIKRVQEKADEMGYYPNAVAQNLRNRRSNLIILLNFGGYNERVARYVYQLGRLAHESGYDFRSIDVRWWVNDITSTIEQLMGARPEGIILNGPYQPPFEEKYIYEFVRRKIPVISIGSPISGIPMARYDARGAIREITANAIRNGRRRLTLLIDADETWQKREKIAGFQEALREVGAPMPQIHSTTEALTFNQGDLQSIILLDPNRTALFQEFVRERETIHQIFQSPELPDALICANDLFALPALTAALRKGITVPQELMISGFDNAPFGDQGLVSLTSVDHPIETICDAVIEMLHDRIKNPSDRKIVSAEIVFPRQIIWRESLPYREPATLL